MSIDASLKKTKTTLALKGGMFTLTEYSVVRSEFGALIVSVR